jgi:hypothetical protein
VNGKRKVCRIFDAGPELADRYTIAFKGYRVDRELWYPYLAAGPTPFHPGGFGQHGESQYLLTGKHLGKRIHFEDLPGDVKRFALDNI